MTFTWRTVIDTVNILQIVILLFMLRKVYEKSNKKNDAVKDLINKTTLMVNTVYTLKNRVETAIDNFESATSDYTISMKETLNKIDSSNASMEEGFKKDRELYKEIGKTNGEKLIAELSKYEANLTANQEELKLLREVLENQNKMLTHLEEILNAANDTSDEDIK